MYIKSNFPLKQTKPWVEEEVKLLNLDAKHTRKDIVTKLMHNHEQGECRNELGGFYPKC